MLINLVLTGTENAESGTNNRFSANKGNFHAGNNYGGSVKSGLKCSYYNFNGHTKENWYKLISYPPNWKKKEKPGTTNTQTSGQFRNFPKANLSNAENNFVPQ